jgi:hypothetical protein
MKKFIASVSFVMLIYFSFMGFQKVGSTSPVEMTVIAPAEESAHAEEGVPIYEFGFYLTSVIGEETASAKERNEEEV